MPDRTGCRRQELAASTVLTITTSMPPSGARWRRRVIHEIPHEEDASTARLQQVLRGQRVGDLDRVKPFALIDDPYLQPGRVPAGVSVNSTVTRFPRLPGCRA